ncbi:hypothetical protein [Streptomyces albidoflavus]|uniref:Uncharacterized protein n=1 Tax=Streptomyces odorifer TaxID=53450 RepID=A0A7Y6F3E2_9ACTN|nr:MULTISPECIES: hypothetical protein [Streptomyces albidoflavus group]MBF4138208.1 hypothetical protein [Streptomyces albidoflavus]NUV30853.1 hypothetical protein [Streptomyces odorifer]NUV32865.1 hypothetical protein [Streptomyces sp. KAI-27]NUV45742.1 hypothetical protein [Streptomyces sp. CAI-78]
MPQEKDVATEDHVRCAVVALTTVFESLGAEHQALVAEAEKTSVSERRGTVTRMYEEIAQTARTVSSSIIELATVRGLRDLDIRQQFSMDAEGCDYSPLVILTSPSEVLHDIANYLAEAAETLGRAYKPTKKYPGLAVARCPRQMKLVFSSLRAALDAVCTDLSTHDPEVTEDHTSTRRLLTELEDRVCPTIPSQSAGPSAEEVVTAIRANPAVARAAAAALARLGGSRPAALGTASL